MIASGYSMVLYCKNEKACANISKAIENYRESSVAEFLGETAAECRKQARKAGWRFIPGREVICPKCVKRSAK